MLNPVEKSILERPDAPLIIEHIRLLLEEEKKKRHQFYESVSEQQKAEFINGQVLYHSPVRKKHNEACSLLFRLMSIFADTRNLGFVGIEKIMVSLTRNDYEPDICFFKQEKAAEFTPEQMHFPAPDWVVEVLSESTQKIDRGVKFQDYQAHGVSEYWLIDPENKSIEQYLLHSGEYVLEVKLSQGLIKSQAMGGFEIPVEAVFDKTLNAQLLSDWLRKSA